MIYFFVLFFIAFAEGNLNAAEADALDSIIDDLNCGDYCPYSYGECPSWCECQTVNGTETVVSFTLDQYEPNAYYDGVFSSYFGLLSNLVNLNMAHTKRLSGSIVTEIGLLKKLEVLHVDSQPLDNTLPSQLGLLTGLTVLNIHETNINITYWPTQLLKLTNLKEMHLQVLPIVKNLPQLSTYSQLQILKLDNSPFVGIVPANVFAGLSLLTELTLGANQWTTVADPKAFLQLKKLESLSIYDDAKWQISFDDLVTAQLTNLRGIEIHESDRLTTISPKIGLLSNLEYISLQHNNQLTGLIPAAALRNLTRLTHLEIHGNPQTEQPLPDLSTLTNLDYLGLDELYSLRGSIPNWIATMTALTYLNLANNKLNGTLPAFLGTFKDSMTVYLNDNDFSGTLPNEILALYYNVFYAYGNKLTGKANFVNDPNSCKLWNGDDDNERNMFCDCPYDCCEDNTTACPTITTAQQSQQQPSMTMSNNNNNMQLSTLSTLSSLSTVSGGGGDTITMTNIVTTNSINNNNSNSNSNSSSTTNSNVAMLSNSNSAIQAWMLGVVGGVCCLFALIAFGVGYLVSNLRNNNNNNNSNQNNKFAIGNMEPQQQTTLNNDTQNQHSVYSVVPHLQTQASMRSLDREVVSARDNYTNLNFGASGVPGYDRLATTTTMSSVSAGSMMAPPSNYSTSSGRSAQNSSVGDNYTHLPSST